MFIQKVFPSHPSVSICQLQMGVWEGVYGFEGREWGRRVGVCRLGVCRGGVGA